MAISKVIPNQKVRASLGVYSDTKEKFDNLVEMLNHENKKLNGAKAANITRDDVLNELIEAYSRVCV